MKILVCNDDGVESVGLVELVQYLRADGHEVYVAAPKEQQSCKSNSMTLYEPLYFNKFAWNDEVIGYCIYGTPADCVKLAHNVIFKGIKFDYIISGINIGSNVGIDALYSGTISAAVEGSLLGIKSIAISMEEPNIEADYLFATGGKFIVDYLKRINSLEFPYGTILNINIPNIPYDKVKGFKYTKQGDIRYIDSYAERTSPRGRAYYWHHSNIKNLDTSPISDYNVIKEGYISISPFTIDRTNYEFLRNLEDDNRY